MRAETALGEVLRRAVNRAFGGRLLGVSTSGSAAVLPMPETTRQALLLNALDVAVYTTDRDGAVTLFNDAAVALWGQRPVIGDARWCGAWKLYTAEGEPLPHDQCPMAVAIHERRAVRGISAIAERPDGSRVKFQPFPTPVLDEQGKVLGAVNLLFDLSNRERAEHLRSQAARCRRLSRGVDDNRAVTALLVLAGEYEEQARSLETIH